jgi:hypothetical protein
LAFQAYEGREASTPAQYDLAFTGAMLWGEHIDNTRAVRMFLESYAKNSAKAARGSRRKR